MRLASRGNPLLTPEEAKTVTVGFVLTPTVLPRFSMSVDFWETRLENAITNLNYANDSVQAICLASAPSLQLAGMRSGGAPDHGPVRSQLLQSGRQHADRGP